MIPRIKTIHSKKKKRLNIHALKEIAKQQRSTELCIPKASILR